MNVRRRMWDGGPTLVGVTAGAGLMALVMLRVVVAFVPDVDWVVDPRQVEVTTELGSAAAAITDLLIVFVMMLAVADTLLRGMRPRWWLLGLWAVGFAVAMWHAGHDADSLLMCGNWSAAMAAGVAAAHLGSDRWVRRMMLASLVALIIPLGGQAVYQVAVEQPASMRYYEEQKAAGKPAPGGQTDARKFEQRLMQIEATGRIGFSNVFGTVVMGLTLCACGVVVGMWVGRREKSAPSGQPLYRVGIAAAIAVLGVVTLGLTFSKGAVLAFVVAGCAVVVLRVLFRGRPGVWPWVAVGVVVMGVAVVVIRGAVFGEIASATGERSLLFRWQYWTGAMRMIAEAPLLGVTPGGFAQRYLVLKNPLSPEDVADPHNVFMVFIATLGVGGWAWGAALVGMVVAAGKSAAARQPLNIEAEIDAGWAWGIAAGIGVVVFATQYFVELPRYWWEPAMLWLVTSGGWIAAAAWLMRRRELDHPLAAMGVLGAVMGVMLQAQIEMSVTNMMAGPVVMVMVGVGSAASRQPPNIGAGRWGRAALWLSGAAVVVMLLVQTAPAVGRAWDLHRAAEAVRKGNLLEAAMEDLPSARSRISGPDDATLATAARLWLELADAVGRAGRIDDRDKFIHAAVIQPPRASASFRHHLAAQTLEQAYRITGDRQYLGPAVQAAEAALEQAPYSIPAHLAAADLAWEAGDVIRAKRWYARLLELDGQTFLDPNRQMTPEQRRQVEARLK